MAMPYIYAQFKITRTILTCLTLELRNLNLYIESSTCKNLSFNKKKTLFRITFVTNIPEIDEFNYYD